MEQRHVSGGELHLERLSKERRQQVKSSEMRVCVWGDLKSRVAKRDIERVTRPGPDHAGL